MDNTQDCTYGDEYESANQESHIAGGLDEPDDIRELLHSTRDREREHFARSFAEGDEDASSFNDDEPPPSEEEYFSDQFCGLEYTNYEKPLTRTQFQLNQRLAKYTPNEYRDNPQEMDLKHRKQQAILKSHKIDILHKRNMKALARIEAAKNNNFEALEQEADYLLAQEILDKKLDRPFYYAPDEPLYFRNILRQRVNAIKKKYDAYTTNRNFRDEMERKVYDNIFNVNAMQNSIDQEIQDYTIEETSEQQGDSAYGQGSQYASGDSQDQNNTRDDSDPFGGNYQNDTDESSIHFDIPSSFESTRIFTPPAANNNNNRTFDLPPYGGPQNQTYHQNLNQGNIPQAQREVVYTIKMPSAMSMLHIIRCALGEVHLRKTYSDNPAQYNSYLEELNELLSQVLTLTHM